MSRPPHLGCQWPRHCANKLHKCTCLQPATGSQWLRVLLQLPTPGEGAPLWDSGISLWTLRSSPARPQLVLGALATVPGAPTLEAKRLASASAFDKASFPDRANTDEMARQPKGTLEEVDPGVPTLSQVSANWPRCHCSTPSHSLSSAFAGSFCTTDLQNPPVYVSRCAETVRRRLVV